jgi:hypothetical protein
LIGDLQTEDVPIKLNRFFEIADEQTHMGNAFDGWGMAHGPLLADELISMMDHFASQACQELPFEVNAPDFKRPVHRPVSMSCHVMRDQIHERQRLTVL